jgi:uncharacterized protein YjbI with pentapeptide repeats
VIGAANGDAQIEAFLRGVSRGQRTWDGLTLPWNADLRGAMLGDCDLGGATLRGARLEGATLAGARLVQADLRKADLRGADLRGADLTKADLCEADLVACDLRGALLEGMAVSFGCRGFAGVALSGGAIRQLYSLILMTRPDDPDVVRALESLRSVLGTQADEWIGLDGAPDASSADAELPGG